MNKLIAAVLLVVAIMESATAFSTGASSLTTRATSAAPLGPSLEFQTTSSTALNLKVKVDPNAKTNNSKGNAKMAAYGGSVAFAVLLPIAFLVWSAVSK
ncbi:hypothetical protein QTG54_010271 [Skeletonema marinoi]|uniref:Transmembrane protein n=1 Tax=Skeletonema marinoi TaxID=267567 RepID=A0AAD8Y4F4_9STRA|nr:hypothetical protein QTG54_010271 [Skeletonema marinoi]|eukprot:CAMPEP_0113393894 /NCGR_PEP_ID=MMETSP0013_2-20120614/12177_1 /TAXON_ID=2843 ORGANISM="Skeletonema costatum, Strain 1716" /NCGR_SAMPLE_ID=MMETSP0013_2 /ASSEMBLY_ACC=CAM_ASM_000158 /LENGTH=98 /DNA_ID=CAMNT_0000277615 /DNA_START=61 /DNA_END=357 /DNA_ORIENTATION=- /assembly_acc=CAM_ASM_000158